MRRFSMVPPMGVVPEVRHRIRRGLVTEKRTTGRSRYNHRMSDARSLADVRAHQPVIMPTHIRVHRLRISAVSYGLQIQYIECAITELTRGNATALDVLHLMRLRNAGDVHPIPAAGASQLLPRCDAVAATRREQVALHGRYRAPSTNGVPQRSDE